MRYSFLKRLSPKTLELLLKMYNHIWIQKYFHETWKLSTIIPIPKPRNDTSNPGNYRPISLTSWLCKTLERMVNHRLVWYLKANNLITNAPCGYQNICGCINHLSNLESYIREAFIKGEHVTTVFFDCCDMFSFYDFEKAYDTTWKFEIMIFDFGLKGRLPKFIKDFLSNWTFKVLLGSTLLDI